MGRRLKRLLLIVLLCSFTTAGPIGIAVAAEVKGQLILGAYKPPAPAALPRKGYNWELGNGFKETLKDSVDTERELAVVLVGDGEPKGLDRIEARFHGGGLMPQTLVVRTGTTLRIQNEDEIAHELVAAGLEGFSAEATSPRSIRSVNLKQAGNWPLHDQLVSHLRGHLHVLPNLVAVAKLAGNRYSFGDVSPGSYTLKVFHADKELVSQVVEVGPRGLTVDPITLTATAAK